MLQVFLAFALLYAIWFLVAVTTGGDILSSLSAPLILVPPGLGIAWVRYRNLKRG